MNFGLALSAEASRPDAEDELTGTPLYMAPELADGQPAEVLSDLWSLGAVLYLVATGQPAFAGNTVPAVVRDVAERTPASPQALYPEIPTWLSDLIMRCLEKKPAYRLGSAATLVRLLEEGAAPAPLRKRCGGLYALAEVALLIGVASLLPRSGPTVEPPAYLRIVGKQPRFPSVQAAVDAAEDGDVIECLGAMQVGPTVIEGTFLTFRPVAGARPTFFYYASTGHVIQTDSPLILEGLSIASDQDGRAPELAASQIFTFRPDAEEVYTISAISNFFEFSHAPFWFPQMDWPFVDAHVRYALADNLFALPGQLDARRSKPELVVVSDFNLDEAFLDHGPNRDEVGPGEGYEAFRLTERHRQLGGRNATRGGSVSGESLSRG
ncbi:MAG: hypothetical protein ACI9TH_001360 [Kiritimatiellia bacterium]